MELRITPVKSIRVQALGGFSQNFYWSFIGRGVVEEEKTVHASCIEILVGGLPLAHLSEHYVSQNR